MTCPLKIAITSDAATSAESLKNRIKATTVFQGIEEMFDAFRSHFRSVHANYDRNNLR